MAISISIIFQSELTLGDKEMTDENDVEKCPSFFLFSLYFYLRLMNLQFKTKCPPLFLRFSMTDINLMKLLQLHRSDLHLRASSPQVRQIHQQKKSFPQFRLVLRDNKERTIGTTLKGGMSV